MAGYPTKAVPQRVIDRLRSNLVMADNGCWLVPGSGRGYGQVQWWESGKRRVALAHRALYEAVPGQMFAKTTATAVVVIPVVVARAYLLRNRVRPEGQARHG